ncbi:response regulator [Ancylobacter defluvii]|uniref:Response regulator n=1 Tax=Ancylobacter defluvii TaxID=1282440 RepID=A0A9W6N957_9HYPH|nr:response regulator [Ancylobacter defluvii]MBS7589966.1 response regulator [Ancylobacter defluvii]GLK83094.1 response regulator [Ancylobacter defluvii]
MSSSKRIIAIVDDDIRLLESLENLLESAGYAVRTFSSPKALLAAGLADLDCLITDIGMPEMDGFQLREAIGQTRPNLPIFLVTGRHEIADRPGKSALATALFRKPIDGQLLLAAVEKTFTE